MTERDSELDRLLRQWEVPLPAESLDERVFRSITPARRASRKWIGIAAALAAAAGGGIWMSHVPASAKGLLIETRVNAAGFKPVSNGSITVLITGEKE